MDFLSKNKKKHTSSCRFPRLKCNCPESSGYQRLSSDESVYELDSIPENRDISVAELVDLNFGTEGKDNATEKQADLQFFNDDGTYHSVVIEKNLCASDLCQVLALKNRLTESINWSIIEHWTELGIERMLEDHEYVLVAFYDMKTFSKNIKYKFIFRNEYAKYEFFHDPQQFFPSDMLQYDPASGNDGNVAGSNNPGSLLATIENGNSPIIYSHVWFYNKPKRTWNKFYMILKEKKLFYAHKVQALAKFAKTTKSLNSISLKDYGVFFLAEVSDFHVYATLNAKNQLKAPAEFGLCLRPNGLDSENAGGSGLICLSCNSEKDRTCWITAMRLAKYGKQLRDNYRAFKNKQSESINPKDYNSFTVPNESVRSRVAMDFTGSVGRIVEDPKEAKAIAVAEGYSWRKRWRPSTRSHTGHMQGIESGVHITQPWFHSGMSRDQATSLVSRHGTVDGVFLVRESQSNIGAFVLTYKISGKVQHAQITAFMDSARQAQVFSLDGGATRFYDLLQLVEFYQLNAGCLPTRLTHYVVQSTNIIKNTDTSSKSTEDKTPNANG